MWFLKVYVRKIIVVLQPFSNWSAVPNYKSPDWWSPYNKVKHDRLLNYKEANLKNVLNALAALYTLEQYFVKYIGDRDGEYDVPNDVSQLFEMVNYVTKNTVVAKDSYLTTEEEIRSLFNNWKSFVIIGNNMKYVHHNSTNLLFFDCSKYDTSFKNCTTG